MRILRWMSRNKRKDMIQKRKRKRNEEIRLKIGEIRLRWFGHV